VRCRYNLLLTAIRAARARTQSILRGPTVVTVTQQGEQQGRGLGTRVGRGRGATIGQPARLLL
jgi:hypothetical protein